MTIYKSMITYLEIKDFVLAYLLFIYNIYVDI